MFTMPGRTETATNANSVVATRTRKCPFFLRWFFFCIFRFFYLPEACVSETTHDECNFLNGNIVIYIYMVTTAYGDGSVEVGVRVEDRRRFFIPEKKNETKTK